MASRSIARKRVLVLNCYFPERRQPLQLVNEVPQPLAPVFLAGAFNSATCDVRIYNEVASGFLELYHPELLEWPDLVVFCGLTPAFDRMLQVSAHLRTQNPKVITIAGGLAIRSLPRYSRRFFDYTTTGDVEAILPIIEEALGPAYRAERIAPRYDLADYMGRWIGYVESSRNCNFRCSFCTLTADALPYRKQPADSLREQIVALGRRELIHIQDNQFFSADRPFLLERLALLKELREQKRFGHWSGFVTNTFFWSDENIRLARESGCFSLLVGVESFDEVWLRRVDKTQNVRYSQTELIQRAIQGGVLFQYGLVFDPTERTVAQMTRELEIILDHPDIPAPNFIFNAIPFPGTPFFRDRFERGLLLPNTKVRDLEGSTLSMKPIDEPGAVADFLRTRKNFRGLRTRLLAHQVRFLRRNARHLGALRSVASTLTVGSVLFPAGLSNWRYLFKPRAARTHISSTDLLDVVYAPARRVDSRYESWFRPTAITDGAGALNEDLAADLLDTRYQRASRATRV